jgi:predicted nucleotidyltransferase
MTILLSQPQRDELLRVFRRFKDRVERIDAFGSRTRPGARAGADIDLAIEGDIDWDTLAEIRAALDESYLSIQADVIAYRLTGAGAFRREVEHDAQLLFDRRDLEGGPDYRA